MADPERPAGEVGYGAAQGHSGRGHSGYGHSGPGHQGPGIPGADPYDQPYPYTEPNDTSYPYTEPYDYSEPSSYYSEPNSPPPHPSGAPHRPHYSSGPYDRPETDVPPSPPGPAAAAADGTESEAGGEAAEESPLRRPGQGRADRRRAAKRIKRRRRLSATKEIPLLVGVALLIAWVLKTFLVQAFVIPSGSMEQTIRIGDRVLVDKLTPWFGSKPQRGDVVVFQDPGGWLEDEKEDPQDAPAGIKQGKEFLTFIGLLPSDDEQDLIKRVVGVGGDTVRCCDKQGRITVNGEPLNEPYIHPGNKPSRMKFKVTVPVGRVFVMGDHRANSADSRYHLKEPDRGTIGEDRIVGRAIVIAWPFDHWRRLEEPETYASVPEPGGVAAAGYVNRDNRVAQLPFSAELPLVMGMVGLSRWRNRRMRSVRSGRGGLGGRQALRFRVPGGRTSWYGRYGWQDGRRRTTGRGKRE